MADRELAGKTVFVTGGSGFVGRALLRELVGRGARVRALTRDATRVTDVVEAVPGDLDRPDSYRTWLRGCEAVIHAARSTHADASIRAHRDVEGARSLLRDAIDAGVRRFVQLSSIAAYGITPDGTIDETAPRRPTSDPYACSKVKIEKLVLEQSGRIETVVIQPANVYGPGGGWWSGSIVEMMRRGRIILVNGGSGIANLVHVNDLARAIRLAVGTDGITEQCFLITDGRPMTWAEYFGRLERMLGRTATIDLDAPRAKALSPNLNDRRLLARAGRWFVRTLLGRPIVFPLSDESIDKFACRTVFSVEKARRILAYEPTIDIDAGIATWERAGDA